MNTDSRRSKVNVVLDDHGLDALVFLDQRNLRYHCGFTGSDGFLVITRRESVFMSDSRYTLQANEQVEADRVAEYKVKADGLVELLREIGASQVGFEATLAYGVVCELQNKGESDWHWRPLGDELARLRLHKDEAEIEKLQRAAQLNATAFAEIIDSIVPGVEERELALQLEFALKRGGAEDKSFDFIVASGPRGALPHGVASKRVLQHGELVTIDFGGRLEGYHADETVTLGIGEVPLQLRKVYDVVREAHDRAIAAVCPGVPLR
ncbi:MAG: integrase, partial [Desulfuromonas sp.]